MNTCKNLSAQFVSNFSRQWKKASLTALIIMFILSSQSNATDLGKINIQLSGTVVALSCDINVNDKDQSVMLGAWPTRQLQKSGDRSSPIMFTINLTGCPAGRVTAVFNGKGVTSNSSLLALTEESTAKNVAIEIQDENHKRVPLGQVSPYIRVDANGNARLQFYANYFILANSPVAGSANSDATFTIYYE